MSDVNRLKEILSRSKAVMQATEQNHGSTSNMSNSNQSFDHGYEEKEIPNLTENYIRENQKNNSVAPVNGRYRNISKSKMPDFIKQAMIENPIDIPETPFHTFELDDVADIVNEQVTRQQPKASKTQPINESVSNLNENAIRKIVREEIGDIVRSTIEEYLGRSLVTEDIQIKVGGTTFSGKLKPLPKRK